MGGVIGSIGQDLFALGILLSFGVFLYMKVKNKEFKDIIEDVKAWFE